MSEKFRLGRMALGFRARQLLGVGSASGCGLDVWAVAQNRERGGNWMQCQERRE